MTDRISDFVRPYCITKGRKFSLRSIDPTDTGKVILEEQSKQLLSNGIRLLDELQERLYAQDQWALLLIFQAMDAAGKDGAIEHVMSGVNPQGCQVYSFKVPSSEELDHDYMWRTTKCLPERGRIGIFNRSYYEEVLVARVHDEVLANQRIPRKFITKHIWRERFEDIRAFETYLSRNGVMIRKFFLHISKKEQKKRFLARLDDPNKNWKFSLGDARERRFWNDYMNAYENMIQNTATKHAPWYVVPADNKWFTRLVVAGAVIEALREINPKFPRVNGAKKRELQVARRELLS